ncbi:MAG TPA: Ig-like domain-containing protein [Dehalococcoidia bacterium]|nr:Ig-like domain-containing protein [Dehalococcoidia bacterium]
MARWPVGRLVLLGSVLLTVLLAGHALPRAALAASGAGGNTGPVASVRTVLATPPTANNDSYTTPENVALFVPAPGVLANDSFTAGDAIQVVFRALPLHGSGSVGFDGSVAYFPNAGFVGVDTMQYNIFDATTNSSSAFATVSITVTATPLVAVNDSGSVTAGGTLSVAAPGVLANDAAPFGDTLTAVLVTGPAHGALTLNADGSYSYTPAITFQGADGFSYRIHDATSNLESNVATVTLTVAANPLQGGVSQPSAPASGPFAYVANGVDNTVSVIDTSTNRVVATVPVGLAPQGVAVNLAGTRVYVTNAGDNTVSVIDASANKVVATVNVGRLPLGIAVNPAGTRVYVANFADNTVSVIDAGTNSAIATLPVGAAPVGVVVNPAGTRVYVSSEIGNTVAVIDTGSNQVIATVPVNSFPIGVAMSPSGARLYVVTGRSNSVAVIDTSTNAVVASLPAGQVPVAVVANPAGTRLYVTDAGSDRVSVIDIASGSILASVPVGLTPIGLAITPDGASVYVANSDNSSVSVIDTRTNTVAATVLVGSGATAFGQFIRPGVPGAPFGVVPPPQQQPAPAPPVIPIPLFSVSVTVQGCGNVTPPGGGGPHLFGDTVTLQAVPCAGSSFVGWAGGPCSGTAINPCAVVVPPSNLAITAIFRPQLKSRVPGL